MLSRKLLSSCFERFDELLSYGDLTNRSASYSNQVSRKSRQRLRTSELPSETRVLTKRQQWQSHYLALLQQVGVADALETAACTPTDMIETEWAAEDEIHSYLSILELFMNRLENNSKSNLLLQLEAKIGLDFIDQAERIFSRGLKQSLGESQNSVLHITASIALSGAVLEKVLYSLSREKLQTSLVISQPRKYERINQLVALLKESDVIDATIAQQVCDWLDLQDKAITEPEKIEQETIQKMMDGTRHLLEMIKS